MNKILTAASAAVAVCVLMTACSRAAADKDQAQLQTEPKTEITQLDTLPQNEYTAHMPVPESGSIIYETKIEGYEQRYYTFTGVTRSDAHDYIELLTNSGFKSSAAGEENEASGGWIYEKNGVYITVSHSAEEMVVGVLIEEK